jgi:hypothetical protein
MGSAVPVTDAQQLPCQASSTQQSAPADAEKKMPGRFGFDSDLLWQFGLMERK